MSQSSESTGPEVVCVGSALVDEEYLLSNLPEPDGGAYVREHTRGFGGVAANLAVALSRYGRTVELFARVGDDEHGDAVEANLESEGVGTGGIERGPEPSTYCMVFRDASGERFIVTGGRSAREIRLDAEDRERLRSAEVVVGNAFCPDPVSRDLVDLASEGVRVSFDLPGPIEELEDRGTERETLDELLPHLSLFVCGGVAAESYLGVRGREAVDALRERGVRREARTPAGRRARSSGRVSRSSRSPPSRSTSSTRPVRATPSTRRSSTAGFSPASRWSGRVGSPPRPGR